MYQPPQFTSTDRATAARLMREHPFASLISNNDAGVPFVTHLPLHLEDREGAFFLLGHCARPNPHWRFMQERPTALVTFLGLPDGATTATITSTTQLLRPVTGGTVRADAVPLHRGRTTVTAQTSLFDDDGRSRRPRRSRRSARHGSGRRARPAVRRGRLTDFIIYQRVTVP